MEPFDNAQDLQLVRIRETFCTYLERLRREIILDRQGIRVVNRPFGSTERGPWYALEYDVVMRPQDAYVFLSDGRRVA